MSQMVLPYIAVMKEQLSDRLYIPEFFLLLFCVYLFYVKEILNFEDRANMEVGEGMVWDFTC